MSRNEEIDDLDDLDDLLDEFAEQTLSQPPGSGLGKEAGKNTTTTTSTTTINEISSRGPGGTTVQGESLHVETQQTTTTSNSAGTGTGDKSLNKPGNNNKDDEDPELSIPELDDQFAEQLTLGVDHILKEMEDNPDAKESFERLMKELGSATGAAPSKNANTKSSESNEALNFQESIARTMEKLKESNEKTTQESEDDFLAKMLKDLERASGGAGGGAELDGLLAEMLKELSSKEILYEPMREMADKYPKWLEDHESELSEDEKKRYKEQLQILNNICTKFEASDYSDSNEEARSYIAEQMEKMQQSGAPPEQLMSGLAGGAIPGLGGDFDLAGALGGAGDGDVPADCNLQ